MRTGEPKDLRWIDTRSVKPSHVPWLSVSVVESEGLTRCLSAQFRAHNPGVRGFCRWPRSRRLMYPQMRMKFERAPVLSAFAAAAALAAIALPAQAQGSASGQATSGQAAPAQPLPDAPQATAAASIVPNGPFVVMDTSMGRITCQFYQQQAPKTVANFIALAEGARDWTDPATKKIMRHKPLYNGTLFHRVIPEFMIQGGDPLGNGMGDPGYTFDDEFDPDLSFDRPGRLAMANSGPNTNGSQFFITEAAYPSLDMHYTLFGQCDDASVDVVKTIARVPRDANDKPLTPVLLSKVTIVPEGSPMPPLPAPGAETAPGRNNPQ